MQYINSAVQLGRVLAARRKTLGIAQTELAAKVGVSQNRLSELENSADKLTVGRLLTLLNVLGLELVIRERTAAKTTKAEW
jgi:HTH-type transcriptional regulator / antitoxin HipB